MLYITYHETSSKMSPEARTNHYREEPTRQQLSLARSTQWSVICECSICFGSNKAFTRMFVQ